MEREITIIVRQLDAITKQVAAQMAKDAAFNLIDVATVEAARLIKARLIETARNASNEHTLKVQILATSEIV